MNHRGCSREGRHSSRRLVSWAVLLWASAAWGEEPAADNPKETPVAAAHPIDLYLGSARELLPQNRWDTILAAQPTDAADEGDLPSLGHDEDIQVEGARAAPKVPGGIASLFWALRHPTQAWRALAPAPTQ